MSYLRRHDFEAHIREKELDVLDKHPNAIEQATAAAIEKVRSYIDYHYDASKIFVDIKAWDPSASYSEGDIVSLEAEEWKSGKKYDAGDIVEFNGTVYECLTNGTSAEEPEGSSNFDPVGRADTIYVSQSDSNTNNPNTSDWSQEDPRHQYLKMIVMDVALYNLFSMTQPDNIPEYRMQRKEEGVEWLEKVAKNQVTANLPERLPNDNTEDEAPSYGGFPNRQWNY